MVRCCAAPHLERELLAAEGGFQPCAEDEASLQGLPAASHATLSRNRAGTNGVEHHARVCEGGGAEVAATGAWGGLATRKRTGGARVVLLLHGHSRRDIVVGRKKVLELLVAANLHLLQLLGLVMWRRKECVGRDQGEPLGLSVRGHGVCVEMCVCGDVCVCVWRCVCGGLAS